MKEHKACFESAFLSLPAVALAAALAACGSRPAASTAGTTPRPSADPASISLAVSPARAALVTGQTILLTATTNDRAGVVWSVSPSAGEISSSSGTGRAAITFTAPGAAGIYTVTANSVTDPARKGSVTVAVTDLAGVYTYHDDLARDGVNAREYALTPADVNGSSFGKLFSCPVDGAVYAQPLWVSHLNVSGRSRNVVFVATAHDSLYAFDADATPCIELWRADLIGRHHGSDGGEVTVPAGADLHLVGKGDGDITPEVGVMSTPVIDPTTGTLYVVSKSVVYSAGLRFHVRLHAIDLRTGAEKPGSPVNIEAGYAGEGGVRVRFDPRTENQRAGLAFANGTVYVGFGSHEDGMPFYGW